ncbi:CU044_5270 family protein [Streptomyces sp. NPDC053493]|uniref:CU044_5270 family protein n=1 Tax=Streptomyces sp. NPDC053493 TaxID=3365705 RepID=UPI0037D67E53
MKTSADDARLRAELVSLLPAPEVPDLDPARRQALRRAVLNATQGRAPRRTPWTPRFAVPVATACAALAAALVVTVATDGPPVRPAPNGRTADGAAQVLGRAALAASATPQETARPEQFVYVESLVAHASRAAGGDGAATLPPAHRRQVWQSVDGSREGLLREAGAPDAPLGARGRVYALDHRGATPRPETLEPPAPSITRPTPAYVAALPTDPATLLDLVYAQTRPAGGDPHQRAFTAIGTLLAETWSPPRVTAALYEAAARIPGTVGLPSATDAAGREGVAVARTAHGEQTQWIFDRTTSAFLGERTVLTRATAAGPAGTVLGTSAVLGKAVTDEAGA